MEFPGFCADCLDHPDRRPDWLGTFSVQDSLLDPDWLGTFGVAVPPLWVSWAPAARIGEQLAATAAGKNQRAADTGRWQGPIRQPRVNSTPMPIELTETLKVKCRHGHDRRRRLDWIRAEAASRIAEGSPRPIYI